MRRRALPCAATTPRRRTRGKAPPMHAARPLPAPLRRLALTLGAAAGRGTTSLSCAGAGRCAAAATAGLPRRQSKAFTVTLTLFEAALPAACKKAAARADAGELYAVAFMPSLK